MVQGDRKLGHADELRGKSHAKGTAATKRRAAPKAPGYADPHAHKTTAAIKKRIESLMAGRLAHEGGTLSVVPRPEAVSTYDKGRPRTGASQNRAIFAASMARRARMKQAGVNLPELGAHADDAEPVQSASKTKKRKRGLNGFHRVGDDWFNEEDAALEAIKYESDDSEFDDADDETAAPEQAPVKDQSLDESVAESVDGEIDEDGSDFDMDDFEECSDDEDAEEEEEESTVETSVSKQSTTPKSKSNKQNKQSTSADKHKSANDKQSTTTKPATSKAVIGSIGAKKNAANAAKRGKSLLGGWFAKK